MSADATLPRRDRTRASPVLDESKRALGLVGGP